MVPLLDGLLLARGTVDRAADLRLDSEAIDALWASPTTRVMRVCNGRTAIVREGDSARLALQAPSDVDQHAERIFLGRDADAAYFGVRVDDLGDVDAADLREIGALLDDRDAGLLVTAVALDNWHATHGRCPRCGAPTTPTSAGWVRRCVDDATEHYPRTDPAVIVLVRDPDDRALLGRQARWPEGWFSTLAGFVEPGESSESAVAREVFEEAGVRVSRVDYLGSQPWPFPCSLMLGYHGWTDEPVTVPDGDEIAELRWFSREELAAACETGEVRLPPDVSIARRLIERWYGARISGDWSRPLAR